MPYQLYISYLQSKRSSPSSSAEAPSERLGSSRSGTLRLRDFHSIEFRPADIPVWSGTSRERLLRASRPTWYVLSDFADVSKIVNNRVIENKSYQLSKEAK